MAINIAARVLRNWIFRCLYKKIITSEPKPSMAVKTVNSILVEAFRNNWVLLLAAVPL